MSKAQSWYVYIVHCADKTLYTGVTTDIKRRMREHNGEVQGGAKYTRVRRPVTLAWSELQEGRSAACKREAQIKRMNRQQKLNLINKKLPMVGPSAIGGES